MTPFTLPTRCEFLAFADRMFDAAAILQGIDPRGSFFSIEQWPEAIFFAQTLCDLFDWLETGDASWRAAWALDDPQWFRGMLTRAKHRARDLLRGQRICPYGLRRFNEMADCIWREVRRRQQSTAAFSLSPQTRGEA